MSNIQSTNIQYLWKYRLQLMAPDVSVFAITANFIGSMA